MANNFNEFAKDANPFADGNPFDSSAPTEVDASSEAVEGEVIEGEEAAPKKKREMAPRLTPEQKKYILQNYHSEGVVEVAKKLEINDNQVRNTIKKTRKDLENLVETLATEEEKAKYVKFMEEYLPKRVSVDEEGNVVRKRRGPAKDDTRSLVEEMLRGLAL